MIKKQNLLIITDVNYWKREIGSHQRVYTLIEYLKSFFELTIAYTKDKIDEDDIFINQLNHKIVFINELEESKYDKTLINDFIHDNSILNQFYEEQIVSKIQTLLNTSNFSHIIVEYIKLSYLFPLFKDKITILDTHDIMNKRNESFKKNNQKHWIDISETQELNILNNYNKVICIQKTEYDYLQDKQINSICCPHPISTENFLNKVSIEDKINVIFIAGFSVANNNSIKWFLENIWIFFKDIENLQLNIYGDVSRYLQAFQEKFPNMILNGKVENLKDVYKNATISINPVQMGGGLKIKNIEALGYGIPLITTSEGSKGLEDQINKSFFVANTKDEWLEKLLSLVISEDLRFDLSKSSVDFISKYFNNDVCFKDLVEFIKMNNSNKNENTN